MIYELTKTYRNGSKVFYIELAKDEELTDDILESIGDATEGGQNYGYTITPRRIRKLPKGARLLPRTRPAKIY